MGGQIDYGAYHASPVPQVRPAVHIGNLIFLPRRFAEHSSRAYMTHTPCWFAIAGFSGVDESEAITWSRTECVATQCDCIARNYLRLALRVCGLRSGNSQSRRDDTGILKRLGHGKRLSRHSRVSIIRNCQCISLEKTTTSCNPFA